MACALDHDGTDFIEPVSLKKVWLAGLRVPGGLVGAILKQKGHIMNLTRKVAPALEVLLSECPSDLYSNNEVDITLNHFKDEALTHISGNLQLYTDECLNRYQYLASLHPTIANNQHMWCITLCLNSPLSKD